MKVRDIGTAVPSQRIPSETVAEWTGSKKEFLSDKIGIESRAFLGPKETAVTLARQACDDLFARNPTLDRTRVGLLVFVTQNPDFKLPHSSALLQNELGLGIDTACFDVNLGCSGWVYALTIAKAFMHAEEVSDAIIVTSDPYSKIMAKSDRDTVSVFGDAAAATWLSAEAGGDIGRADFGTDGAGAGHLIVKAGGGAQPLWDVWSEAPAQHVPEDLRLHMNGRAIFTFMMERVPASVGRCLAKNGLALADVDQFAFHQASRFLLENLRDRMKLPAAKVPCGIAQVGNTVSSSIPLLLAGMKKQGTLRGRILVSGFGVGLSWATNVVSFGGS